MVSICDDHNDGHAIIPNVPASDSMGSGSSDSIRCRADGLGMPDFGMPYAVAE
jgi:hypothetical protein